MARSLAHPACFLAALFLSGCAATAGHEDALPPWPYAGIRALPRLPPELAGQPAFMGQWIQEAPGAELAYADASDPRFLMRIPLRSVTRIDFLDLGAGARVETLGFLAPPHDLLLVASVAGSQGVPVSRAILLVDARSGTLLDVIAMPREAVARGLAVDASRRRVFLLEDDGAGSARVRAFDLYGGRPIAEGLVGNVPAAVSRKGLALRRGRTVLCLSGGAATRSDFEPRSASGPHPPELLLLDADSLRVEERVALDPGFTPAVLVYDDTRDRAYVLEVSPSGSRVLAVDAAFGTVRARIDLPEPATDLVLAGGYAFAPSPYGIYAVDLATETRAGGTPVPFGSTRELVVAGDLSVALVMFQSIDVGGAPGIAAVAVATGEILDVLQ